jgi:uncharacterized membrane protein YhdT
VASGKKARIDLHLVLCHVLVWFVGSYLVR